MSKTLRSVGRGIERLVGSDLHEGEWHLVLLFFANLFLLLTAYYILKVVGEPGRSAAVALAPVDARSRGS